MLFPRERLAPQSALQASLACCHQSGALGYQVTVTVVTSPPISTAQVVQEGEAGAKLSLREKAARAAEPHKMSCYRVALLQAVEGPEATLAD